MVSTLATKSIVMLVSIAIAGCVEIDTMQALPSLDSIDRLAATGAKFPDKVTASRQIGGYFRNFIWGDYFYAVIKTDRGKMIFSIDRDEDCFLASHPKSRLVIQYDWLQRYIPEAGGYYSISVISNIQTAKTDLATWRKSLSPAKLKQCRQLVDRATKSN
jgi:hypothetical protein